MGVTDERDLRGELRLCVRVTAADFGRGFLPAAAAVPRLVVAEPTRAPRRRKGAEAARLALRVDLRETPVLLENLLELRDEVGVLRADCSCHAALPSLALFRLEYLTHAAPSVNRASTRSHCTRCQAALRLACIAYAWDATRTFDSLLFALPTLWHAEGIE